MSSAEFSRQMRNGPIAWPWLLVGFGLLPFTIVQTMLPLAAWLAPIFLLRFVRIARRTRIALLAVFVAHAVAYLLAARGGASDSVFLLVINLSVFEIFRGFASTLPYAADRLIGSRLDNKTRIFVFPLAFTTVDWLMTCLPPINSTESSVYSQHDGLAFIQILSVTGMWGIIFLIGWCASIVNVLWESGFDWRRARGAAVSFVAVLVAAQLYGSIRLSFMGPLAPTVVAATITIDPALHDRAISPPFNWITFNRSNDGERAALRPRFQVTADQMLERSERALRAGAKIVAWQETGAMVLEEDRQDLLDRASDLAKRYDAFIQVGLGVFTRSEAVFSPIRAMPYYLNQSILIDNVGKIVWTYAKSYPVFPAEAYVTPYGPGQLPIADTPYGRLATAICNDFHFPSLIGQAGRNDVDIMLAPYNSVHPFEEQDAQVAIMRAVENGYSMVRATGFGSSLIADYQGRVVGSQKYGEGGGVMLASIPTRGVMTIYGRIGDAVAYLCALGLLVAAARAFLRKHSRAVPI